MKIGLLIIGNEILEGKISDANTRALSLFLKEHHLELSCAVIAKDQEASIHQGLSSLFSICDIIITSGGLGPTADDVTKEALASFWGKRIIYSEESFQVALNNYKRMNRPFAGKEHGYCFLPEGFLPLDNSTGFAPCFFGEHKGKYLLCAPGVPREFQSFLKDHFARLLFHRFPKNENLIENITIRTKGVPEEKIFGQVDSQLWEKLSEFGAVSSLPTILGVDIGVKIIAKSSKELEQKKLSTLDTFKNSPIHSYIWQQGHLSLEEYVVKMAIEKKVTFVFAESCTGGLCSHRITNISGSSQCFLGSIICYSEDVKKDFLDVDQKTLSEFGAVSAEVAAQMSLGAALRLKSQIAISITGLAGPLGGSEALPVGSVYFGITQNQVTKTHHLVLSGDREQLKLRFSQMALFLLLDEMIAL